MSPPLPQTDDSVRAQLAAALACVAALRRALVDLVGASTLEDLQALRVGLAILPPAASAELPVIRRAIDVLIDTLPLAQLPPPLPPGTTP